MAEGLPLAEVDRAMKDVLCSSYPRGECGQAIRLLPPRLPGLDFLLNHVDPEISRSYSLSFSLEPLTNRASKRCSFVKAALNERKLIEWAIENGPWCFNAESVREFIEQNCQKRLENAVVACHLAHLRERRKIVVIDRGSAAEAELFMAARR